ncbi:hypothetical protein [Budvicia aquatica]|uniref:Ornithine carbamoyltransferase n=1 Tax=Budvicia aquatica TaxID=82979 RepID=A0A2C6DSN7_9GAMM|nr:hypothetical protein [Budvicia aquatica]PHI32227.1 ornithine carbamoyltransferase [Budvicia aquatica]
MAIALAGYAYGAAFAGTTGTSATIKGLDASTLVAPSSGLLGVDFSFVGTQKTSGFITVGDKIQVAYHHGDTDGDADATAVVWHWYNAGGTSLGTVTDSAPVEGETYTFNVTAPPVGAHHLGAVITGNSATGDPRTPIVLTIADIGQGVGNPNGEPLPDVGGGGPIISGTQAGGIFLTSSSATAGSGATNYGAGVAVPKIGDVFELKVWDDANSNGIWDTGEADLTSTLTVANVTWNLGGMAATADSAGTGAAAAAPAATSVLTYTIPVNGSSHSGQTWGDQGYTLRVSW